MKISEIYSHLNGLEYLLIHKKKIWEIDVGIEVLPMKSLQKNMSSGVAYYEGELYNIVRQGRGVPAVPVVLIGVDV